MVVYITGEIESVERCCPGQSLTGKWNLDMGSSWSPIQGLTAGDLGTSSGSSRVVFQAPIDLHLACSCKLTVLQYFMNLAAEGWPRVNIEITKPDGTPVGLASVLIPNVPGHHILRAPACLPDDPDVVGQSAGSTVQHTATVVLQLDVLFACMRSNGMGPESWEVLETVA